MAVALDWIAVDWGTSKLRIWAMTATGAVIAERSTNQGMATLQTAEYEQVLLSHINGWLPDGTVPVIACGMVGSRQGWAEAPYADVPTVPAYKTVAVPTNDNRLQVNLVSGIKQRAPADVMRGEETQIAGFLAQNPDYCGLICLPGTHSKWVTVNKGVITAFHTWLTGELFALLTRHSILRHSLGDWDDDGFKHAVDAAFSAPAQTSRQLFEIRARTLLQRDACGIARISGTLIGAELAGSNHCWQRQSVAIIGNEELTRLYSLALQQVADGLIPQAVAATDSTIGGLYRVYQQLA